MDNQCINNIKSLAIDMIDAAGSGHPGIALGAAPIIYTVYSRHLVTSYISNDFENRDRFILSAGHGSALLYATYFMAGFEYSIDDLKKFRQFGSKTPGHPEYGVCPRVETTTGPLGQGIATAVGMAIGMKIKNETHKQVLKKDLFDSKVYVLCGDGDLMEGISYEAASLAGTLSLNNLIVLYDSNKVSLDGKTDITFTEDVIKRFEAMGWYTLEVKNGDSVQAIDKAIIKAKKQKKPTFIKINTKIGKDSLLENTNTVHGKPLTEEDIKQLKAKLKVPNEKFYYDQKARNYFRNKIMERSTDKIEKFHNEYNEYIKTVGRGANESAITLRDEDFEIVIGKKEATRVSNSKVMQVIADTLTNFVGGSADLASSTMVELKKYEKINKSNFTGKNICFGVREHAMGAILNGLALTNFKVFGSTFLVFSDYLKAAIRLSALMKLPVNYIFTHDSITVGEDGATHQPIEQIAMLRSIPNLYVFRPCDIKEVIGSWQVMINSKKHPNALILSRGECETLKNSSSLKTQKGAYIIRSEKEKLDGIIIATGSEVETALDVANTLYIEKKLDFRVVSMPCLELFEIQDINYKNSVLSDDIRTFTIEAGSSYGLCKYATNSKHNISIDSFGVSGKKEDVIKYFKFTKQHIVRRIEQIMEEANEK